MIKTKFLQIRTAWNKLTKKNKSMFIVLAIVILIITVFFVIKTDTLGKASVYVQLSTQCSSVSEDKKQIDCVYKIIREEMIKHNDIASGVQVFAAAQNIIKPFRDEGLIACHEHFHYIGDVAYYDLNRYTTDLSNVDFPQETSSCTYGFFHGFIEHLIQDNPDPKFSEKICNSLVDRLSEDMSHIMGGCYHGVGHAFLLTHIEKIDESKLSDFYELFEDPISKCSELSSLPFRQKCWDGIFHTFISYGYNFSQKDSDTLDMCNTLKPKELADECYFFIVKNIQVESGTPISLRDIVTSLEDDSLRDRVFRYGIVGITNRQTGYTEPQLRYKKTLALCQSLEEEFFSGCIRGIVKFLSGTTRPAQKIPNSFLACSEPTVIQRGMEGLCYKSVAEYLPESYTKEQIEPLCLQFPENFREECNKLL